MNVATRLSRLAASEEIFNQHGEYYNEALARAGYEGRIKAEHNETPNNNSRSVKKEVRTVKRCQQMNNNNKGEIRATHSRLKENGFKTED